MFNLYSKKNLFFDGGVAKLSVALGAVLFSVAPNLALASDWSSANSKVENGLTNQKYNYYSGAKKSLSLNAQDIANEGLSGNIAFALSDENIDADKDLSGYKLNLKDIDFLTSNLKQIYGAASHSGTVSQNTVNVSNSSDGANVQIRGGHSYKGKAEGNIVNITASKVDTVLGGSSRSGIADKNKVVIKSSGQKASEVRVVHGGRTWFSNHGTNGNEVQILGSHAFWVYGGESQGGSVSGNRVSIGSDGKNKSLSRGVFGGKSRNGTKADVNGNEVSIIGSDVEESYEVDSGAFGGRAEFGNTNENKVSISSDGKNRSIINSNVYGADSTGRNIFGQDPTQANKNEVKIIGSVVNGDIFGANSAYSQANENKVEIISDGANRSKAKNVYGGKTGSNGAIKNSVSISSADISGDVYGGYMGWNMGDASDNSVTLQDTSVGGDVYGGYNESFVGDTTGNVVNLKNNVVVSGNIIGGRGEGGTNFFSGNTLNLYGKNITAKGVSNFEYLNFYLPKEIAANDTVLSLNGVDKTDLSKSKIGVGMVQGGRLNLNDRIALINSAAEILYPNDMANHKGQLQAGISAVYDFKLEKDADNKKLYAVVSSGSTPPPVPNPQPAPFSLLPYPKNVLETSVAELGALSQSADLLASANLQGNESGAFGAVKGSNIRYESGSHVDVKSLNAVVGVAKNFGGSLLGAFIEFGGGSYDSYNDFNVIDIRGDGNFRYYGVGLSTKLELSSEFYAEASAKLGRIKTDYKSDMPAASQAEYEASRNYYGTHVGVGKIVYLSEVSSLDLYTKVFYLTLGKKDVQVVGDDIELKQSNSLRAKAGAKYSHKMSENFALYAGAAFEREFMGEAKGYNKTYNAPIQSPSIKGNSAIAELGMSFDASEGLNLDLKAEGMIGKKRGAA